MKLLFALKTAYVMKLIKAICIILIQRLGFPHFEKNMLGSRLLVALMYGKLPRGMIISISLKEILISV
jgi:hypothetical protein